VVRSLKRDASPKFIEAEAGTRLQPSIGRTNIGGKSETWPSLLHSMFAA